ncbi:LysR substrate-binding domain-containing protein [Herbaspirillum rubrisubalbicans]|uniref:LysR family transcriptional regulator n=1 Tax=Herbaspirillum rubrisubalbicans Os34 TaxID=1235827 RepID=A0A6M3ZRZ8_9BURK|nr:LysR substrate-binding domain-containing protein [Herbaspirillum rubrisubalbicans]QJQ01141.1 LysR family transcriptional regulator [Herbaspirillum rubrisubalbicans Os34]
MARPLPPLDLLVSFEAAARLLSFSKAGAEIFVTQSAISRQVKKLEQSLDMVLFERLPHSLMLTEQGRIFYDTVRDCIDSLTETISDLKQQKSGGRLKVSTNNPFASLWLVPRLASFREEHPEIELHISADNRVIDLKQETVDLAIRYTSPNRVANEDHLRLSGEEIFPVCSPELLSGNKHPLNAVEDLRHYKLLHLEDPQHAWPWLQWSDWFEHVNRNVLADNVGFRFSHIDQMIQAASMGQGVALGSSPLVDFLLAKGALVAPLKERRVSPRAFFACYSPRCDESAKVFVRWIQEKMALSTLLLEGRSG